MNENGRGPRAVGRIYFDEGQIQTGSFADIEGDESIFLLMSCKKGFFEFRANVESNEERNVFINSQSILLEGMRRMDEAQRALNEHKQRQAAAPKPAAQRVPTRSSPHVMTRSPRRSACRAAAAINCRGHARRRRSFAPRVPEEIVKSPSASPRSNSTRPHRLW